MYGGRVIALGSPAELKKTLGAGHLLHLETSDLHPSLVSLAHQPGILDVAVFGGGLHVTVADESSAEETIRRILEAKSIRIATLEPIPASMEDVFVSLIEKEERAA